MQVNNTITIQSRSVAEIHLHKPFIQVARSGSVLENGSVIISKIFWERSVSGAFIYIYIYIYILENGSIIFQNFLGAEHLGSVLYIYIYIAFILKKNM
jgi:hypothetical protein